MSKHLTIFLDTNIFLHYQLFDQINWLKELSASKVTLVIPPIVLRELEKHKINPDRKKIRERAKLVVSKLAQYLDLSTPIQVSENIELSSILFDPTIDFSANQLSQAIADDWLLASILSFKSDYPDIEIVLVTADLGLKLKAKQKGIRTFELNESLRLAEEPDLVEQENKKLKQEILELKNIRPQLKLTFSNDLNLIKKELSQPEDLSEEEIQKQIEEIKRTYPQLTLEYEKQEMELYLQEQKQQLSLTENQTNISSETPKQPIPLSKIEPNFTQANQMAWLEQPRTVAKYNEELEKFYGHYAKYLKNKNFIQNALSLMVQLDLKISNEGTQPAQGIDVYLHFPDGFTLIKADESPEFPSPPSPPNKWKPGQKIASSIAESLLRTVYTPLTLEQLRPGFKNISAPIIKRTNSYDVEMPSIIFLKHNTSEPLPPLILIFDSFESACSFKIDFKINANNVPKLVVDKLHVILKKIAK